MKKQFLFAAFLAIVFNVRSQVILITDTDNNQANPINCAVFNDGSVQNFYDSGNAGANYGNNENVDITICPSLSTGSKVSVSFGINAGFSWNVDASDTIYVYDGPTTSSPLLGKHNSSMSPNGFFYTASWNNPSGCLSFKFVSDGAVTGTGWAANITCGNPVQPFEPHILAFLNGSGSSILAPADTGYADICFNDSILFEARGDFPYSLQSTGTGYSQDTSNCTYLWKFSDGTQKTGRKVWFKPPARSGYLVTLRMTDPVNQIEVMKCKVRVSTIPSFAGTGPLDDTVCVGQPTQLIAGVTNTDTVGVDPTQAGFEFGGVFAGLTYLPDGSGAVYTTTVNISDFNPGQTITQASDIQQMCVVMEHSYLGDLEMRLTCPNGTNTTIFNSYSPGMIPGGFNGGGTFLGEADDNGNGTPGIGWQYCFADNATWGNFAQEFAAGNFTNVTNPPSPSTGQSMSQGQYKPEQSFANFIGCPINGNWTITIQDNLSIDDGYIFEWGVFFNPAINPNTEFYTPLISSDQWLPDPTIVTGQNDTAIIVIPNTVGPHNYTYQVTDNFGCTYDTTVTIYAFEAPTLPPGAQVCDFSYQMSGASNSSGLPVHWTLTSSPAGASVSYSPDSLSLNPYITVSAYGDYTFSLSNGLCEDDINFTFICDIEVPNVFTPNGDGINDALAFRYLEYHDNSSLKVYNRWGVKVYESADYENQWTGGNLSDGVYYFILEGPNLEKVYTGYVQLIRGK